MIGVMKNGGVSGKVVLSQERTSQLFDAMGQLAASLPTEKARSGYNQRFDCLHGASVVVAIAQLPEHQTVSPVSHVVAWSTCQCPPRVPPIMACCSICCCCCQVNRA